MVWTVSSIYKIILDTKLPKPFHTFLACCHPGLVRALHHADHHPPYCFGIPLAKNHMSEHVIIYLVRIPFHSNQKKRR